MSDVEYLSQRLRLEKMRSEWLYKYEKYLRGMLNISNEETKQNIKALLTGVRVEQADTTLLKLGIEEYFDDYINRDAICDELDVEAFLLRQALDV